MGLGGTAEGAAGAVGGACPAAVTRGVLLANSVAAGLVNADGKLAQVLSGIENSFATNTPSSNLDAVAIVQDVTQGLGLGAGVGGLQSNGNIVFENVGGIVTTIFPNGEIVISRGSDILLHLIKG
jgi:hypothetical protein